MLSLPLLTLESTFYNDKYSRIHAVWHKAYDVHTVKLYTQLNAESKNIVIVHCLPVSLQGCFDCPHNHSYAIDLIAVSLHNA